jgi:hypothetical protein
VTSFGHFANFGVEKFFYYYHFTYILSSRLYILRGYEMVGNFCYGIEVRGAAGYYLLGIAAWQLSQVCHCYATILDPFRAAKLVRMSFKSNH